jgi:hypothetical protein
MWTFSFVKIDVLCGVFVLVCIHGVFKVADLNHTVGPSSCLANLLTENRWDMQQDK